LFVGVCDFRNGDHQRTGAREYNESTATNKISPARTESNW